MRNGDGQLEMAEGIVKDSWRGVAGRGQQFTMRRDDDAERLELEVRGQKTDDRGQHKDGGQLGTEDKKKENGELTLLLIADG